MAVNRFLSAPGGPAAVAASCAAWTQPRPQPTYGSRKASAKSAAASGKAKVLQEAGCSQIMEIRKLLNGLYRQGWSVPAQVADTAQTAAFVKLCDLVR